MTLTSDPATPSPGTSGCEAVRRSLITTTNGERPNRQAGGRGGGHPSSVGWQSDTLFAVARAWTEDAYEGWLAAPLRRELLES